MAQFGGVELTNAGRALLAKVLTGKTLKFTCGWAGDGYVPEGQDVAELQDVISRHRQIQINNIEIPNNIGTASISLELSNKELIQGFFIREVGIFAEDPDTGREVLYGYCNSGDTADFIPGQSGVDVVFYRFDITVVIGQAEKVTAVFAENPLHVSYVQFNESNDKILRYIQEKIDGLQEQINKLSQTLILNSANHFGNKHLIGDDNS